MKIQHGWLAILAGEPVAHLSNPLAGRVMSAAFDMKFISFEIQIPLDDRGIELLKESNARLLHAVLCSYAKHTLECDDIGWLQLNDILHAAICNEIGDDAYCAWLKAMGNRTP